MFGGTWEHDALDATLGAFSFNIIIENFSYDKEEVWDKGLALPHTLLNAKGLGSLTINTNPCGHIPKEKLGHGNERGRETKFLQGHEEKT
jgi:hypothetical protein